jgi:hypothetical protein
MLTGLLIVSFIIFTLYIRYIKRNYGEQKSISSSYYNLTGKKKWYFTLALLGTVMPIAFVAVYNEINFIMFIAAGLIGLVGVSPAIKNDKYERIVHMIGAFGGYILAMVSLVLEYQGVSYLIISLLITWSLLFNSKNPDKVIVENFIWKLEEYFCYIILFGLYISIL